MKRTQTVVAALVLAAVTGLPLLRSRVCTPWLISAARASGRPVTAASGQLLGALVSSLDLPGLGGASFDSFKVFNSAGFSFDGSMQSAPGAPAEVWTLSAHHLMADSYYLLVSGIVRNDAAGNYVGSVAVSAVPEPSTYGMLLGGAGIIGW